MNKRIKELAEQAGFVPYYDLGTGEIDVDGQCITVPNWSDEDPHIAKVQKFAELIVKECLSNIDIVFEDFENGDIFRNQKIQDLVAPIDLRTGNREWDLLGICEYINNIVKEHFGVE